MIKPELFVCDFLSDTNTMYWRPIQCDQCLGQEEIFLLNPKQ